MGKIKHIGFVLLFSGLGFISVRAGKIQQDFLSSMGPAALEANFQVMMQRSKLQDIYKAYLKSGLVSAADLSYLTTLGEAYEMKNHAFVNANPAIMLAEMMEELLNRVDVVPVQLVLAQSIIETGWGRSKSARETHNYFGITSSMGGSAYVVTTSGSTVYYLASFSSDTEGIKAYISLLNSKLAYAEFRKLRSALRKENNPLDATRLSEGLMKYSELGQTYIDKVNFVIHKFLSSPEFATTAL